MWRCLFFPLLANAFRAHVGTQKAVESASDTLAEENAMMQPTDTRNIRYVRNANQIFEAAIAKATEMGAGVSMVLADHEGTVLRVEATDGGNFYRNIAVGKVRALIHNDLDNSRLCQRTLCVAGAMASYAFTGRAGVQGAVMFGYYHPEAGQVTGFFSVSGNPDMWDDVLIAKTGLEEAGYTLVNGETDVYGFGLLHEANQIANTGGFQGSLLERLAEEQPVDTRNIRYIRNVNGMFDGAILQANNMSESVCIVLSDHNGSTLRTETVSGGSRYCRFAEAKVRALMHHNNDIHRICQTSLCAAGQLASYPFTGRLAVQGSVMLQYFAGHGLEIGYFTVSGCLDMWDDVLIAKTGLEGAGWTAVNGESSLYGFGLSHDFNNAVDGFQGSR